MSARLLGHTAVVPLDPEGSEAVARRLAREGASVILVAADADRGGRLAAAIESDGAPSAAVFCSESALGETDLDALVELVAELDRRAPRAPRAPTSSFPSRDRQDP